MTREALGCVVIILLVNPKKNIQILINKEVNHDYLFWIIFHRQLQEMCVETSIMANQFFIINKY